MESEGGNTTVAGILAIYGVREFGRFAGAYKTLFGESPSETLKRAGASVRSSN
jgi:AraC family ethanolamine operon transcriptional activator